jgi:hypothetical protein
MHYVQLVHLVPRRVRTVARFRAPDPWQDDRLAEFSIEAYRYVQQPEFFTNWRDLPLPRRSEAKEVYGLRSELDGRQRLLPDALSHLWKAGRLPAEVLPALLRDLRPQLSKTDYRPLLAANFRLTATIAATVLGVAALSWWMLSPGGQPPSQGDLDAMADGVRRRFFWEMLGMVVKIGSVLLAGLLALRAVWHRRREGQMAWALGRVGAATTATTATSLRWVK